MKIFLIRHGETTGDVEDRYGGDYDDELTEKGKLQAEELATKLTNKNVQTIYHSPRIRARQTAEIVSIKVNVPLLQIENIRERNHYGILTGMIKSEAITTYPEEVATLKQGGFYAEVKNAEPYLQFKQRVVEGFKEIVKNQDACIAIISHGGVIREFMRNVAKAGELSMLGDCSIIELAFDGTKYIVLSLDGVALK